MVLGKAGEEGIACESCGVSWGCIYQTEDKGTSWGCDKKSCVGYGSGESWGREGFQRVVG